MNVDVKEHISVVMIPAKDYSLKELTHLSDEDKLEIARVDKHAKYYPNLHSFQASLNLGLIDTDNYWTFFLDV